MVFRLLHILEEHVADEKKGIKKRKCKIMFLSEISAEWFSKATFIRSAIISM
jgi:hypothetical protein